MRFRAWLEHAQIRSYDDALSVLGLSRGASLPEAEDAYLKQSKVHHPDRPGGSKQAQQRINNAIDYLRKHRQPQSTGSDGGHWEPPYAQQGWGTSNRTPPPQREQPPWQTDKRSSNNVGEDFRDINFCKKAIYEEAIAWRSRGVCV